MHRACTSQDSLLPIGAGEIVLRSGPQQISLASTPFKCGPCCVSQVVDGIAAAATAYSDDNLDDATTE